MQPQVYLWEVVVNMLQVSCLAKSEIWLKRVVEMDVGCCY